jgi:hypothetical protein
MKFFSFDFIWALIFFLLCHPGKKEKKMGMPLIIHSGWGACFCFVFSLLLSTIDRYGFLFHFSGLFSC